MTDRTELQRLLERVEAATGPDRELDAMAAIAFHQGGIRHDLTVTAESVADVLDASADDPESCPDCGAQRRFPGAVVVAPVTASIDAALALVERVLPEWQGVYLTSEWTGLRRPEAWSAAFVCTLRRGLTSYITAESGERPTLPLAILAALLRAKISEAATA